MGQVHTSYRKIASACRWVTNNEQMIWGAPAVGRLLRRLAGRDLIELKSQGHGTVITVVNYPQFKGFSAIGV